MGKMEIRLNIGGLKRLNFEKNFTFHLGKQEIKCSRSQAAFLSKACYDKFLSDSTVDSFSFRTEKTEFFLPYIYKLINGDAVDINSLSSDQMSIFRNMLVELDSLSLLSSLKSFQETITKDNCVEILNKKTLFALDVTEEQEFISSHFYEIEQSHLLTISIDNLKKIVESSKLLLNNESSLCDLIIKYDDPSLLPFLEYSSLEMKDWKALFDHFSFSCFESSWPLITSFIINNQFTKNKTNNASRYNSIIAINYKNSKFDGVFSYLTNKNGSNPASDETISIIASGWDKYNTSCSSILDSAKRNESDWYFGSNSSMIFDLKSYQLLLTGYSLKAHSSAWSSDHLTIHGLLKGLMMEKIGLKSIIEIQMLFIKI
ncbi:hypothetical protein TRFO_35607 [Tritrichomonas foetus]|uniref:BTB domain-containing protein n=1 Tax=Tritrichomonas foetus TaxID=1144522 RepID=A0A1J4JKG4_9EUKA|nr:hypothetical protein TRFO_35607 [Tritrichomonas foetus]|eukprot:OHS98043.1 hypothetical protein TRFO_35607 [Tritrichomonas foetus]